MELDELLAASAAPVTSRTPQLDRALSDLVADSEAAARWKRRSVRLALVGGAFAGLLGLGTAATAAGILPGWPSFSTSSGQTCQIEVWASALGPGEGEAVSSSFSAAQKEETLAEARTFLEGFDYDSVDPQRAISWWKEQEATARASQSDPDERQPVLNGDDLEVTAVSRWVIDRLRADLTAKGLDIRAVSVGTSSSGCDL
jgi:hypothetical protein